MAILGILFLLVIALLFSDNRTKINIRIVVSALFLQFAIAAFVLFVPAGQSFLLGMSSAVQSVIDYSNEGISFLFGGLASDSIGFIFAIKVLPVIVFVSAISAVLYHLYVMQFVVKVFGGILHRLLGVSRVESLVAVANIFLDQTQSSLVVKPYISKLSGSEFFTVMCSGLASISGAVLVGYASLGVNLEYLIAASFMAAPGGLLMAKIIMPSPEVAEVNSEPQGIEGKQSDELLYDEAPRAQNVIEAAANGAVEGLKLAAAIGAMLLAFVAIIAMLNGLIGYLGQMLGLPHLSLDWLLGAIFSPLMYLLGIPWSEASISGNLIGQKLVLNEFVAFANLIELQTENALSAHSEAVVTFALCGFANLGSLAILLGGLGSIVPERKPEIAQLAYKVIIAGSLSNLMSAAIVSLLLVF